MPQNIKRVLLLLTESEGVDVIRAADLEPTASAGETQPGFREVSP
jgi:hypothetical protein